MEIKITIRDRDVRGQLIFSEYINSAIYDFSNENLRKMINNALDNSLDTHGYEQIVLSFKDDDFKEFIKVLKIENKNKRLDNLNIFELLVLLHILMWFEPVSKSTFYISKDVKLYTDIIIDTFISKWDEMINNGDFVHENPKSLTIINLIRGLTYSKFVLEDNDAELTLNIYNRLLDFECSFSSLILINSNNAIEYFIIKYFTGQHDMLDLDISNYILLKGEDNSIYLNYILFKLRCYKFNIRDKIVKICNSSKKSSRQGFFIDSMLDFDSSLVGELRFIETLILRYDIYSDNRLERLLDIIMNKVYVQLKNKLEGVR